MKQIICILILATGFFSCGDKSPEDDEISFRYDQAYAGDIKLPNGKGFGFTWFFNKADSCFSFRVNTMYTSEATLQAVRGKYTLEKLGNGLWNIHLQNKAEVQYGYMDIRESITNTDNLGEIFPLRYSLKITESAMPHGKSVSVDLSNKDKLPEYKITATAFED